MLSSKISYRAVSELFRQFSKYVKKMFLSITDSVMIFHILSIDILLRLQVSVEVSGRWNRRLR